MFPLALCGVEDCSAKAGNDLVAPCAWTDCCDFENGAACPVIFGASYDPATTTYLRVPPASPTPGAARD